jgi:MFS family permease
MTSARADGGARHLSLAACLALCTIAPLGGLAVSGIAPIMTLISDEFAGNPQAGMLVRLMMSGVAATTIIGSLAAGVLVARYGQLRLLYVLLALYAVSGAGIFLLDDLYAMVGARLMQGIANGGIGVLAIALITTRIVPDKRDRWLGFYMVAGIFSIMLLFLAIAAMADLGWRYAFLIFLLAVPAGILVALTFRGDEAGAPASEKPAPGQPRPGTIPWTMMAYGLLCGAIVTSMAMFLPYHLADIGYGSPEYVALLMVVGTAGSATPGLAFGWIRARVAAIPTFVIGFALVTAGLLLVTLPRELPLIFIGMAVQGVGMGAIMPNLFSACAAATPLEERARMLGFVRAGISAGPLLAQPALEWVMSRAGAMSAILTLAVACIVAAFSIVLIRRKFDPIEEESV